MEIGVGTILYEWAGVPLRESIERIANHGIRYLDILAFGIYNPALYPEAFQWKIAERMQQLEMRASSVITCADGNLACDDKEEVENAVFQLKLAGKMVKRMGGKQVLIGKGLGNIDFDLPRKRAFANAVRVVSDYCGWCLKEDLIVTLELEPESLCVCNGLESMAQLLEAVDAPNLAVNIDIGHLNILRSNVDMLETVKDRIIHVHMSDNDVLAHTNCVIGEGTSQTAKFIDKCIELGIDENAARFGDVAVAGIEVGEVGEHILDPDYRLLKSYGYVLSRVKSLRND